jgi:serine/threonine protein kinase
MEKEGKKVSHYTFTKSLGAGQFAHVYLATSSVDNKEYAVKVIHKSKMNTGGDPERMKKLLSNEVSIMSSITHPNIIHLHNYLESSNNYYLVIDYCNGGDFERYLRTKPGGRLPESEAITFMKQIMNGFQCLHENKIMHRDFKLANLFMHDGHVVIGDFGMAKSGYEMTQTALGSPLTTAPEVLREDSYSSKADLWSVGTVFYYLLFGKYPFFAMSIPELMKVINQTAGDKLPFDPKITDVSEQCKSLLRTMLQPDPAKRIDWERLFDHPLFNKNTNPELSKALHMLVNTAGIQSVDQLFARNRESIKRHEETEQLRDPMREYLNKILPFVLNDAMSTNSGDLSPVSNLEKLYFEASFRYHHENNKVKVICICCKRLRVLMKIDNMFGAHKNQLYIILLALIKKATLLTKLTILSLQKQINIFKIDKFDLFCQESPKYKETLALFQADEKKMLDYLSYVNSLADGLTLSEEEKMTISTISKGEKIEIKKLDDIAFVAFKLVRILGEPPQLSKDQQTRHEYLEAMIFTVFSICSESSMPYTVEDYKFDWDNFITRFANMSNDQLAQELFRMEQI